MSQHHPSDVLDAPRAPDPDDFSAWEEAQQDSPEERESPPEPTRGEPDDPDALPRIKGAKVPTERLTALAATFAAQHDQRSFGLLCRGTQRDVFRAARRMGVRWNDLEDVANLCFATVWSDRASIRSSSYEDFKGFALEVARQRAVDWNRSQNLWNTNTVFAADPEEHCVGEDDCDRWEPSVETIAAAHEAYGRLLPRQQTVVRALLEGWTFQEIAGQMGVSKTRVRQIYAAAVKRLQGGG